MDRIKEILFKKRVVVFVETHQRSNASTHQPSEGGKMFKKVLIVAMIGCFLFGMGARAEAEGMKAEVEKKTMTEKTVLSLKQIERDKKIDEEVRKLIREMDIGARSTDDLISYVFASPLASRKLYNMGIISLPEMLNQIKNKELHRHTRFDLISHLPLMDGIEDYKREVIDTLGRIFLDKDEDILVRNGICMYAFEKFKDTSATPYLIEVMRNKSDSEKIRSLAASAFVSIHDERVIPHLLKLIVEDNSEEVRAMAAWSVGSNAFFFKNTDVTLPLIESLNREKSDVVRIKIIGALSVTNDQRAVKALGDLIKFRGLNYRSAIEYIPNLKYPESAEILKGLLKDEEEATRFDAAKALLSTEDKSIIPDVEKAVSGFKNEGFKRMLTTSIEQLKNSKD